MVTPARRREVRWAASHRIIRTIYPPIALFEDVADPADWELLASAEAKTKPRVRDAVGNLALVPAPRRVGGPGASLVMGAFTHASPDRPGRFSDGGYGVWYCGDRFEVALAKTAHHFERFMRATAEPAGEADFRELVCGVHGLVADGSDPALLDPDDWRPGQAFGRAVRDAGGDGVLYPSVRFPEGMALALFWPDCVELPVVQARQFRYGWDGARMHRYLVHGTRTWVPYPPRA
ncbi:MAG: RES family NAD+ phosphorylase [Acetobacteraceae bacterium]|nr:RES family NAD+ phosphorylase [Acetobacteraceae bacterium]